MAGLLYGVSPTDLPTFAGVTLVLTAVALAASYIGAARHAPRSKRHTALRMTAYTAPSHFGGRLGRRHAACEWMARPEPERFPSS
jgi:hypothetical protein